MEVVRHPHASFSKSLLAVALLVGVLPGPPAAASDVPRYLQDHWGPDDGLPQISVHAVAQDRRGYLWLATEEGLARYDGLKLSALTATNGLHFIELQADAGGGLWVGGTAGLGRLRDGHYETVPLSGAVANQPVNALARSADGTVWIGTPGGLGRLRNARLLGEDEDGPSTAIQALLADAADRLWAGTGDALWRRQAGSWSRFPAPGAVTALRETRGGRLLVGTDAGLFSLADDREAFLPAGFELPVSALLDDTRGQLWVGTRDGLFRLVDGRAVAEEGLPDHHVTDLWEDAEGSLWVGTRYGGLTRLRPARVVPFGTPEGLVHDLVWGLLEDREGNVWIATDEGLTRRSPDGHLLHYTAEDGLPGPDVGALLEDRAGDLWIGTFGDGLARLRGGRFRHYGVEEGVPNASVRRFYEDRRGRLWVATSEGLLRLRDGGEHFEHYGVDEGLPHVQVRDLWEDAAGVLWLATDGGLASLADGNLTAYGEAAGLPTLRLKTLHGDADGNLWIGTRDAGLLRFRDGRFSQVTTADGLFNNYVQSIVEDDAGHFWMSCNVGIQRVKKAAVEALMDGSPLPLAPWVLRGWDGMRSHECNGASQPSSLRTRDGRLWFSTIRGVAIVDPAAVAAVPPPPPVQLTEVQVDHRPVDLGQVSILPAGSRSVDLSYVSLSFLRAGELLYRHRLDGFDDTWVEAGSRHAASYTNLGPGSYTFRVAVRRPDGDWGEEARFSFSVAAAFHESWPFYVISVLVLLAAGRFVLRRRLRHLTRRADELEEMKTELEIKNAELERFTYTVSHDLKSPLFTIEGFLGLVERDARSGNLERMDADVAKIREAIAHMRRLLEELLELSLIGTSDPPATDVPLDDVVGEAVALVAGRIVERGVEVEVPRGLPVVLGRRSRLVQLFQNLLENAVKYMGDQPSPRVELKAETDGGVVVCAVSDNGQGIGASHLDKVFGIFEQVDATSEGTGIGLSLVHRIVETHGGTIRVESEGAGRGTSFVFTLPRAC